MATKLLSFTREYRLRFLDNGVFDSARINAKILLDETIVNDYEYIYALRDIINEVLDLKIGESMYFQPNRDNADSKGIILRVE